MRLRDGIAIVVSGVGAVLSVAWAYRNVRGALTSLDAGGFVGSSSAFELLGYALPVLVTFWLSARVADRGRSGRILRRVYLFATRSLLVIFLSFVAQVFLRVDFLSHGRIGWALFVAVFVSGALWLPVQAVFASGFLGLLIKGRMSHLEASSATRH
jgi:hypothetical protein